MRLSRVWTMLVLLVSSGSPESRTQRYAVISRVRATGPRLPLCQRRSRASRDGRTRTCASVLPKHVGSPLPYIPSVRTGGFEPPISWSPTRRDNQASPRSGVSSSCGSRTRLCALKGRDPQTDRRTSRPECIFSTQVDWEVLESSSAAFQATAKPSQLPVQ